MSVHNIKIRPPFFEAVLDGTKTFELRRDDRGYKLKDILVLEEWNPATGDYTGRVATRRIQYLVRNAPEFGLMPGFCILGHGPNLSMPSPDGGSS